jgi:hypothetical protein
MKRVVLIALVAVACSSSDYDDRPQRGGFGGRGGNGAGTAADARGGGAGIQELLPPDDWWHDTRLTPSVNLTSAQLTALDNIARGRVDEIAKLERDSGVAMRDLRATLDADPVASGEIVNAAQRVRTLRDEMFDRQVEMLAAERTLLSKQQWSALQTAIRDARRDTRDDRRGGYPGGMGGRGGRGGMGGRRPGWPY